MFLCKLDKSVDMQQGVIKTHKGLNAKFSRRQIDNSESTK